MTPIPSTLPAIDLTSMLGNQSSSTGTSGATDFSTTVAGSLNGATGAGIQPTDPVPAATQFSQALTSAIGGISGLQNTSDQAIAGLALNQGVDISQAMLAMDQASLGMQLAVSVRDKAVEAYQTLINMQM